jgi:hypothetical protein
MPRAVLFCRAGSDLVNFSFRAHGFDAYSSGIEAASDKFMTGGDGYSSSYAEV